MIVAIGLALVAPRGSAAHPISLPSAIVDVQPDHVRVELDVMLEDLVLAAVNEAMDKAQELASQRLGAITGGMNIPGLT